MATNDPNGTVPASPGDPKYTPTEPPRPVAVNPATLSVSAPTGHETVTVPNSPPGSPDARTVAQPGKPTNPAALEFPEIPGYEVQGEIARGGMGRILAAHDPTLGRDVAIKVLLPDRSSENAAQRFVVESKITARLPHPAIPPVYELGELPDGSPFLVMKLIRGRTLADELKAANRTTELPRLVQIFEQIAQAVGFAHSQGVIHRDLKPANVMVGAFGEVQVMDWGLARAGIRNPESGIGENQQRDSFAATRSGASDGYHTEVGYVMGTPSYMAPEQARGETVGPPADVFALGGILCAILTDHPPFLGETVRDTLRLASAGDVAVAFSRLDVCGADAELVALAKRLLNPRIEVRPADGKAVADEVACYRVRVEERLRKAETERAAAEARILEQRKRRRVQLALAGAVMLLLAAGGVFAWWKSEADARNARSETARLLAEAETERQQREVRERLIRNRDAADGLLAQTENALRDGDAERAAEMFLQAEKRIAEGGADDLRDRHARCRSELAMLRELDRIDNERWTVVDGKKPKWTAIAPKWEKAFVEYGISPGTTPAEQAAQRINGSFIRERLLASLEVWFVDGGRVPSLRALLSVADPDEFRNEARATHYQRAILVWAFRGKTVPTPQPVWFAVAHGWDQKSEFTLRQQLLLTAHRARPNNFLLLMGLGDLANDGDREAAAHSAGWYRAALAVQPRNLIAWYNLGIALHDSGDYSGAIAAYREAIRLDPKHAKVHNNLGNSLKRSRDLQGAIGAYREAIRLDPNDALAQSNLGNALKDSGDLAGAILAHNAAIRLDPKSAPIHYNHGLALSDSGDSQAAIAAFKEAIRLDPKHALAHNNLAAVCLQEKRYAEAIPAARQAIRLNPKYPNGHAVLGLALRGSGDIAAGRVAFAEAVRLDPKRWEPMFRQLFPPDAAPPPREVMP